ncbi:conserved protein of unknown function [Candidatus Hydrogenisulfobacillus filiaventi]|uniref:Uncharacterized protein n=1 Tax=Candidatus Hydrogenisulfobacillus filiaventi TaxID=2707344 RepID=A0A6F8ZDU0_9FIRM|nr:hypothetical protein [Bacillota bacterium]CAB1127830.1 conserved protein of unknown function [Candidatus Hydrogenisulfobacillus filiaventi]
MAFLFQVVDPSGNVIDTATASLAVSPTTAIITATNLVPGSTVIGTVNVSNTAGVDEFYQITANWSPSGSTVNSAAARLVNELVVSVTAGSPSATATPLFTGSLYGLVDQPASPGQALPLSVGNENVQFQITLPANATSVFQGIDVGFDIVFVASA